MKFFLLGILLSTWALGTEPDSLAQDRQEGAARIEKQKEEKALSGAGETSYYKDLEREEVRLDRPSQEKKVDDSETKMKDPLHLR